MQGKPEIIPMLLLEGRTFLFKEYSKKALSALSKDLRKRNFETLYVMDVDGVERNKPQLDIIQALCDDFSILYEAGPRRGANVVDLVIAGADIVYMSTLSLASLSEIETALTYSENIGFKVDWNDGVQGHGKMIDGAPLPDVVKGALQYGIKDFVVPVEIIEEAAGLLRGTNATLRAIADRPGDEKTTDSRIKSLIISLDHLPSEVVG
jgi:phosphoribosylformimino-5-aminoimidazole carboxamide ribonucleotide (ProFAR) isomerase